ncbi:GroES-like protein [Lepidopterella palustris CBS 459.81]|uniref:GroES-like protein n=1 Tax=Lepidopterella palustris CBS 459.81 TaxID=1314670 RepID=A0A8E2E960_9PEZI|nr:GroES-like protein [Lepidopterella palustris CBS 459.81]
MKSLLVYYDPELTTKLEDIPIPSYNEDEVLIKVVIAGSNPKDWKHPMPQYFNSKLNQGDDVGGVVAAVGANVQHFRPGDRVAGFHQMNTPRGTYAEYTVCPAHTVFHIPASMSFEEAATIPLAAFTAAVGLYRNLLFPLPTTLPSSTANSPPAPKTPLIINGAASSVGHFAAQLARLNPSIRPIIGLASAASRPAALESGCDIVIDYRSPSATVIAELTDALGGAECSHVFDAVNSVQSLAYLLPVIRSEGGRYTCTTGLRSAGIYTKKEGEVEQAELLERKGVWFKQIWVGSVHDDVVGGGRVFGGEVARLFEALVGEGRLRGLPGRVVDGLERVEEALVGMRSGGKEWRGKVGVRV